MSRKFSTIFRNQYVILSLGICIAALSLFVIVEPVSPDLQQERQSAKLTQNILNQVNSYYVDKSKIDYQKMLETAVSSLERKLDDVMVVFPENEAETFIVQVSDKTEIFEAKLSSVKDVADVIGQVRSFVLSNTQSEEDAIEDIEYLMSDSMLKILDPHSAVISPDIYKEFLVDTRGSFGGLGIVVGIRDGQLTVISPIEGTPAYRSGIKTKDRIVQIENESTINMPLFEAVGKLRGEKGTQVNILVSRKSVSKPLEFSITRDIIEIESVESHDLENDILYLKIKNFQKNTSAHFEDEIKKRSYEIKGMVLDLRGNPGGLLKQANDVVDFLLSSGTIVTTKSRKNSNPYKTTKKTLYDGNLIVLIDQGSASASEIAAGALKNNGRALVLGSRSFGKGSVQKIFELGDGSALKLTIGKFYIPRDISIQDIGVTPDILLQGSIITEEKVVYNPLPEKRENVEKLEQPDLTIKYVDNSLAPQTEDQEEIISDQSLTKEEKLNKIKNDFYVKLSKDLLLAKTQEQTRSIAINMAERQLEEIQAQIQKIGIDWSDGKTENPQVDVVLVPLETALQAGEENFLEVKVTNTGKNVIHRLSAVTDCENIIYADKEFLFGKLSPGQSATSRVSVSIPAWMTTREDKLKFILSSSENQAFTEKDILVQTIAAKHSEYSHNYEMVDDGRFESEGNANGRTETGETIVLNVKLKNSGKGVSKKTVVSLKNLSGEDVFLEKGRFEFENFRPGETRIAPFRFRQNGDSGETEFEFLVMNEDLREVNTHRITLPVYEDRAEFVSFDVKTSVELLDSVPISGGAFSEAKTIAIAQGGSKLKAMGKSGSWIRVEGENGLSGWIDKKTVETATYGTFPDKTQQTQISALVEVFENPPSIQISELPLSTRKSIVVIEGSVTDSDLIESISVWREDDKIKLVTPQKSNVLISFPLSLEEEMNIFTIVAKDKNGMTSRKNLAIRRDLS